jgi:hypothetical protein
MVKVPAPFWPTDKVVPTFKVPPFTKTKAGAVGLWPTDDPLMTTFVVAKYNLSSTNIAARGRDRECACACIWTDGQESRDRVTAAWKSIRRNGYVGCGRRIDITFCACAAPVARVVSATIAAIAFEKDSALPERSPRKLWPE